MKKGTTRARITAPQGNLILETDIEYADARELTSAAMVWLAKVLGPRSLQLMPDGRVLGIVRRGKNPLRGEIARFALLSPALCPECESPLLPPGVAKKRNEYDHASRCPRGEDPDGSKLDALVKRHEART